MFAYFISCLFLFPVLWLASITKMNQSNYSQLAKSAYVKDTNKGDKYVKVGSSSNFSQQDTNGRKYIFIGNLCIVMKKHMLYIENNVGFKCGENFIIFALSSNCLLYF